MSDDPRKAYAAARWRWLDAVAAAFREPMVFKIAYLIIGRMGRPDDPSWSSFKSLAERAQCSEDTVRRSVRALAEKGFIEIERGSGHKATRFYFDWRRWGKASSEEPPPHDDFPPFP